MRSAESVLANATVLLSRVFARLRLGAGALVHRALEHGHHCEVAARLGLQMSIVNLHMYDLHELNLGRKLLHFFLYDDQNHILKKLTQLFDYHHILTFSSSFSRYGSGESSCIKPPPFIENVAWNPRARAL